MHRDWLRTPAPRIHVNTQTKTMTWKHGNMTSRTQDHLFWLALHIPDAPQPGRQLRLVETSVSGQHAVKAISTRSVCQIGMALDTDYVHGNAQLSYVQPDEANGAIGVFCRRAALDQGMENALIITCHCDQRLGNKVAKGPIRQRDGDELLESDLLIAPRQQ